MWCAHSVLLRYECHSMCTIEATTLCDKTRLNNPAWTTAHDKGSDNMKETCSFVRETWKNHREQTDGVFSC